MERRVLIAAVTQIAELVSEQQRAGRNYDATSAESLRLAARLSKLQKRIQDAR